MTGLKRGSAETEQQKIIFPEFVVLSEGELLCVLRTDGPSNEEACVTEVNIDDKISQELQQAICCSVMAPR